MFRKDLINMLLDNPLTVPEIAALADQSPKDVVDDIEHLLKSLKHSEFKAAITVAECRKCGFEFGPDKLRKPSRCPECHSSWLTQPEIAIARR